MTDAIDKLIVDIENNDIRSQKDLLNIRSDADKVHPDGYYFINIIDHRTMALMSFEDNESTILWCGNHDKYDSIFKNNKNTIRKWLRKKRYII